MRIGEYENGKHNKTTAGVMLFLSNEKGYYATSLKNDDKIYLQNRNSEYIGVGLFNTSVLFQKPNYSMMNCDSLVDTVKMSRKDFIDWNFENKYESHLTIEISEYQLPTGQYIYRILYRREFEATIPLLIYKTTDGEIHLLYDVDTIYSRRWYHNRHGWLLDNNISKLLDELDKFITTDHLHITPDMCDELRDSDVIKLALLAVTDRFISEYSELFIGRSKDNPNMIVIGECRNRQYSTTIYFTNYVFFSGELLSFQTETYYNLKEWILKKKSYIDISAEISKFCMEHYLPINRIRLSSIINNSSDMILHDPKTFDFETLKHDPEVDRFIETRESEIKAVGKNVSAKSGESLKKLRDMNWRKYCRINNV